MAKQSRLDKAIEVARKRYDEAAREMNTASEVVDALVRARDDSATPAVKRTRKAKGLPKETQP